MSALRDMNFLTVIDVGANRGSTVEQWKKMFPSAHVYAFEPEPHSFAKLSKRFGSSSDVTLFNAAAGPQSGPIEFEVHLDHESSSSALPITKLSQEILPSTCRTKTISVDQVRLDDVLLVDPKTLSHPIFLKLDVQGYERQVLDGASELLKKCKAVLTEVGVPVLYKGQSTFDDIHCRLHEAGLTFFGFYEQFHTPDGKPVYADVIYARL